MCYLFGSARGFGSPYKQYFFVFAVKKFMMAGVGPLSGFLCKNYKRCVCAREAHPSYTCFFFVRNIQGFRQKSLFFFLGVPAKKKRSKKFFALRAKRSVHFR